MWVHVPLHLLLSRGFCQILEIQGSSPEKIMMCYLSFSSVQSSRSVVSDSLQPHESQHARPPCPSPTPRVHPDSRPSSRWCHPAISSSVVPFSSCPQSLSASESFPMSQLFAWGGQSTGVSALESFLPKKSQGWSPSEWTSEIGFKGMLNYSYSPTWKLKWFYKLWRIDQTPWFDK